MTAADPDPAALSTPNRSMRPVSGRAVAVVGTVILVVTGGAIAGLLYWVDTSGLTGTELTTARLDAVKIGLSTAVGGGGVFALYLAWRRQRSNEADHQQRERVLEHQRQVADDTNRDALERRITELYTRAADQLGSDKATVRLAGIYALERLAQSNPGQRQTIVNVLCAYLRMPLAGQSDNEERLVRQTAQRIIATHLKSDTAETYWADIELDLRGASLFDFTLDGCLVRVAYFDDAHFNRPTSFWGTRFQEGVSFRRAEFTSGVKFRYLETGDFAIFSEAKFNAEADFSRANFGSAAVNFQRTLFAKSVTFDATRFGDRAAFDQARFNERTYFRGAEFDSTAEFSNAIFNDTVIFDEASLIADMNASGAVAKVLKFATTKFSGQVFFNGTEFKGGIEFGESMFGGSVDFDRAMFSDWVNFDDVKFAGDVAFDGAYVRVDKQPSSMEKPWPRGWVLVEPKDPKHGPDEEGVWWELVAPAG